MAINLTVAALASAVRAGNTTEESAELTRLLTYAKTEISRYLGRAYATAPQSVVNEAAIRLVAYLYDMPNASRGAAFANALRNSGAGRMLLGYRVHRAGTTAEAVDAAQAVMGTTDNPVVGVTIEAGDLVVRFADGTAHRQAFAAATGVDLTARQSAQTAGQAAQAAQGRADAAYTLADSKVDAAAATQAARAVLPMPPNTAEARGGTSTALRLWSSALIRAAIDAVLPADDRLLPATGNVGDVLFRQTDGAAWTSFRSAVLSIVGQGGGGGVGPLVTRTFTSNATPQRYSATGFVPPTDWLLLALEDRQTAQVFSGLTVIDLEYMRGIPAADRPAAGAAYPAVDAGQGVYALDAAGQLLAATFAASVAHTLIYRRLG